MWIWELCIGEFGKFIVSRVFIWECIELVVFFMYFSVCLLVMCMLFLNLFLMLWRVICWLICGFVLCIIIMCMFKLFNRVMLWIIFGKLGCLMVLLLNIKIKVFFWWVLMYGSELWNSLMLLWCVNIILVFFNYFCLFKFFSFWYRVFVMVFLLVFFRILCWFMLYFSCNIG